MPFIESTKIIHEEMLVLIEIFDKFCRERGIKYSLHGGTLLGAVREKGFIPWDDDVDITLMRSEFDKLQCCIEEIQQTPNVVCDFNTRQGPVIWLKRKNKPAVWIDIFIYDYITDNIIFQKLKILGLTFFLGITKSSETLKIAKQGAYKGWKYTVIYCLYNLGKLASMETKTKYLYKFASNCFLGNKKYIQRTNDQYAAFSLIVPKEVMEEYIDVEFEGKIFMISKYYEPVLISCYGMDYMTPKRSTQQQENAHNMYREAKK